MAWAPTAPGWHMGCTSVFGCCVHLGVWAAHGWPLQTRSDRSSPRPRPGAFAKQNCQVWPGKVYVSVEQQWRMWQQAGGGHLDISTGPRTPCVWIHLYRALGQYMAFFLPYYGSWKILEQMLHIKPACVFACCFSLTTLRDCHLRC